MTPKEKADDLVSEFIFNCKHTEYVDNNRYKDSEIIRLINSKQCAVICVDEMIGNYEEKYRYCSTKQFLEEVKKEIKKL